MLGICVNLPFYSEQNGWAGPIILKNFGEM
mgnify:CR=1 FL=1